MNPRRLALAASASLGFVAAASCALQGFNRVGATGAGGGAPDAGGDSGVTSTGAAGGQPTCKHASIPDPPPAGSDTGADIEFVVAIHSLDLSENTATTMNTVGLDLDTRCTCEGQGASCRNPGSPNCDGPDGRDNAAAGLFKTVSFVLQGKHFGSTYFSEAADMGAWTLLIRVRHFDGSKDDPSVEVSEYASPGLHGLPAKWDGNDAWPVSSTSVNGSVDQPKYVDPNAYVSGGILVAALPHTALEIGGQSSISLYLEGGFLTGQVMQEGTAWVIRNGTFAARWPLPDVFASFASYRANNGKGICKSDSFYSLAKGIICASADILAGAGNPSVPCDALSFGINFQTDAAKIGVIKTATPPAPACAAGDDPSNDFCGLPPKDGGKGGGGAGGGAGAGGQGGSAAGGHGGHGGHGGKASGH